MKRAKQIFLLITALLFISALDVDAQSFFDRVTARDKSKKAVPTVITSDAMDFDITKNIAVFTGNVQVDDANMRILCHKMIVRFEGEIKSIDDLTGDKKDSTKNGKKDSKKDKKNGGGKVKDITCIKNVIIIRKLYSVDDKEKAGEQKAIAGHAVYDVKTGKITLTDNPALIRGEDTLRGETIIYWVDSERVSVRGGKRNSSELKIRSNQE